MITRRPLSWSGSAPTVLLVHGAFADASWWAGVIAALQAAGMDALAPANPLRGLAADAAYVASVAAAADAPVLLVGHAYGGAVGVELYIKGDQFPAVFAADLPARVTRVLAVAQRPIVAAAFEETARVAAWEALPAWYAVATADQVIHPEAQRFMARRAGAQAVEVVASHAISLSQPAAVADLIRTAAAAIGPLY